MPLQPNQRLSLRRLAPRPLPPLGGLHDETLPYPAKIALGRWRRTDCPPGAGVRSVPTDDGCEFLGSASFEKLAGCNVYDAQAYAAWEKGSVEAIDRLVRSWHPQRTDFSKVPVRRIRILEARHKSIHRESLGGPAAIAHPAAAGQSHSLRFSKPRISFRLQFTVVDPLFEGL